MAIETLNNGETASVIRNKINNNFDELVVKTDGIVNRIDNIKANEMGLSEETKNKVWETDGERPDNPTVDNALNYFGGLQDLHFWKSCDAIGKFAINSQPRNIYLNKNSPSETTNLYVSDKLVPTTDGMGRLENPTTVTVSYSNAQSKIGQLRGKYQGAESETLLRDFTHIPENAEARLEHTDIYRVVIDSYNVLGLALEEENVKFLRSSKADGYPKATVGDTNYEYLGNLGEAIHNSKIVTGVATIISNPWVNLGFMPIGVIIEHVRETCILGRQFNSKLEATPTVPNQYVAEITKDGFYYTHQHFSDNPFSYVAWG